MLPPSPPWPEVNSKAYDSHYGQAHGKERERKKRKKKHTTTHTQRPRRWTCSLWGMRAPLLAALHCRMLTGEPRRRPRIHRAIRFTYPRFYRTPVEPGIAKPGRRRSPKQPSIHGLCLGLCALFTRGYSNVLAHALQDSTVGSDSGTPKLPRSTLPVLRSTVPV